MAKYLRTEWMKKPALRSNGIVEVLEQAKGVKLSPSNQLSEANFKNVKINQDVHKHCSEPAEYINHRWEDTNNSNRLLMSQVKSWIKVWLQLTGVAQQKQLPIPLP